MKAGDHIRIIKDGGSEHAIEVGDRTVIHFAKGEGVKRSRLAELASHGAGVEVVTHPGRVFPRRQVVARAFSRFAESAYAAMFQDSESFATWCKTGKAPARPIVVPFAPRAGGSVPAEQTRRRATKVARRAAARRAAKRPAAKKARKVSAAPAKAARSTKASSAPKGARKRKAASPRGSTSRAKPAASAKAASKAKRGGKAVSAKRQARPSRPARGAPAPAKVQKRGASARTAKAEKRRKASAGR